MTLLPEVIAKIVADAEQRDTGFMQVPNEVEDALLASPLTFRQERVYRAILRKTLGFNKASDCIATSQISDMTGIDESDVRKALNDLVDFRMIERGRRTKFGTFFTPVLVPVEWNFQTGRFTPNATLNGVNHPEQTGRIAPHKIQEQNTKTTKPLRAANDGQQADAIEQPAADKPATRKRAAPVCIGEWIQAERQAGRALLAADDPLFASECDKAGLPREFILLCWAEFRMRHADGKKRQADWRQTFRNCVRGNWYKLWAMNREGEYFLTTEGRTAERRHAEGGAA